ncbi:hypothetical protein BFL38_13875 [Brachyspira hampsonii]|uniref:Lipoprotein n=1 Tax=Brachyspira hampsonii TaxID=1287055 RepID=A0A1E5NGT3_9SPIR|nr:hypothetical protein [Brachyspira hampsonii]OEJ15375.1 hypothetical protein BFL38_13875 [Brachyspira hampsonii]
MMKKLFLFTLLFSSFLVISCGNDTTNPETEEPLPVPEIEKPISVGTGIDSKYVGTYENNSAQGVNGSMQVIYEVRADGGIRTTIRYDDPSSIFVGNIKPESIDKYSDTKYKYSGSSLAVDEILEFSEDGTLLTLISNISDDPVVLTKKVTQ